MPANGLSMDTQFPGNPPLRSAVASQGDDGMLQAHAQFVHRVLVQHSSHAEQYSLQVAGFQLPIAGRF
jgi:hypothetical protein